MIDWVPVLLKRLGWKKPILDRLRFYDINSELAPAMSVLSVLFVPNASFSLNLINLCLACTKQTATVMTVNDVCSLLTV